MTDSKIYEDIALRTGGDIYVGVVGPVRTGKSTFIKRFMETVVIPNIDNIYLKERARDELPQSGSGRTVMTAEPKFVPEDAVQINIGNDTIMSVRLIDCVGYMIPGAAGQMEDGEERMVATPWFDHEISMTEAAEEGTRRVIRDHSTIGLVITTDGSICGSLFPARNPGSGTGGVGGEARSSVALESAGARHHPALRLLHRDERSRILHPCARSAGCACASGAADVRRHSRTQRRIR